MLKRKVRKALYRPFCKLWLFFDSVLNQDMMRRPSFLPNFSGRKRELYIWLKVGTEWPMFSLVSNHILDMLPQGGSPVLPLLRLRRRRHEPPREHHRLGAGAVPHALHRRRITKWDIFHYVYGVLHHPGYREVTPTTSSANCRASRSPLVLWPSVKDFEAFRE